MTEPVKTYYRLLIWKPEHDEDVRRAFKEIMGKALMQKNPRQNRWCGRYMIGTQMMTEALEARFKARLGKRLTITVKQPRIWVDVPKKSVQLSA